MAATDRRVNLRRGSLKFSLNRKFAEPDEVMHLQLAHKAGAVGVHGLGIDFKHIGDVLGLPTADEQRKHLHLARTKRDQRVVVIGQEDGRRW